MDILLVHHAGTAYTYTEFDLVDSEVVVSESMEGVEVDLADISVSIVGTFLGVANLFSLPNTEGFRAKLYINGTLEINGVIRSVGGVSFDNKEQTWSLTITQDAQAYFLENAETIGLHDSAIKAALNTQNATQDLFRSVAVAMIFDKTEIVQDLPVYNLQRMWETVLSYLPFVNSFTAQNWFKLHRPNPTGGFWEADEFLWIFSLGKFDTTQALSVTNLPLPVWTIKELYECLEAMLGWRLLVQYTSDISVFEVDIKTFADKAISVDMPIIDNDITEEDFTITREEAIAPDFALRYKNEIGKESVARWVTPSQFLVSSNKTSALYAAEQFNLGGDKNPQNQTIKELPLFLPDYSEYLWTISHTPLGAPAGYTEDIRPGMPVVDARTSEPVYVLGIKPYVAFGGVLAGHFVCYREPGTLPTSVPKRYNEVYAWNLFPNYQFSRQERYSMDVQANFHPSAGLLNYGGTMTKPEVGNVERGVRTEGRNWLIEDMEVDTETRTIDFILTTPIAPLSNIYPSATGLASPVLDFRAIYSNEYGTFDDPRDGVGLFYKYAQPIQGESYPSAVELERKVSGVWTPYNAGEFTPTDEGWNIIILGDVVGQEYRIRTVNEEGLTGLWQLTTAV